MIEAAKEMYEAGGNQEYAAVIASLSILERKIMSGIYDYQAND